MGMTSGGVQDDARWNRPEIGARFTIQRMYSWRCEVEFKYGDRTVTFSLKRPRFVPWLYESYEERHSSWAFHWLIGEVRYWHWKGRDLPPEPEEVARKAAREFTVEDVATARQLGCDAIAAKMLQHAPFYGVEVST